MRTIVVGDIHGCFNELFELIEHLRLNKLYNAKKDKLIFLGDYIDRGDKSRYVVKFIRKLQKNNPNVIALMGNHEDMAVEYFDGFRYSGWTYNGYEHTLESYKGYDKELKDDIEWMRGLPLYHEDDDFIYVHAGVDLYEDNMENQLKETLVWTREEFIGSIKKYHKRVIFGHTPSRLGSPYFTCNNNICIDSGCCFGGALTALVIEDGIEKTFYQVKKGERDTMDTIRIIAQAFYGNNVITEIDEDDIDRFILGYLDDTEITEDIGRTVVKIPNTDVAIIYSKNQEDRYLNDGANNPLAIIPEKDLKIYSRCIACRIDKNGNIISIKPEDVDVIKKYFVA